MSGIVYGLGVVLFFAGVMASIALHEVGHMAPAKLFGVKVTQYFVGFGKTVWSVRRGETEYGVKAFPMGGFIRMVGMLPPPKLDADGRARGIQHGFFGRLIADARDAENQAIMPGDESRLFYRRPPWQKIIIMAGGPMMNVFLAILLLGAVFMGFGTREATLTIDQVSDCVVSADEGDRACTSSDPEAPAHAAGFRSGDVIVSFNGVPMSDWDQFSNAVRANGTDAATVVVERDGSEVTLTTHTTISKRFESETSDDLVSVGFLGVTPVETMQRQGPGYVFSTMWTYTQHTADALLHMPSRMWGVAKAAVGAEPRSSTSPMSVVGASRVAGEVASDEQISVSDRWASLLTLLGVVNLFVALFNFIPLLPLDGGHIAGAVYESLRRAIARIRGRPDPGYADVAQLLPVAYTAASVLIVMGVLLVWADIVNPIRITG